MGQTTRTLMTSPIVFEAPQKLQIHKDSLLFDERRTDFQGEKLTGRNLKRDVKDFKHLVQTAGVKWRALIITAGI